MSAVSMTWEALAMKCGVTEHRLFQGLCKYYYGVQISIMGCE
jgi:hypothetical protein